MAADVVKIVAFLVSYKEELLDLQKPSLEALLKSSHAKQVREWNAAKSVWYRTVSSLAAEQ